MNWEGKASMPELCKLIEEDPLERPSAKMVQKSLAERCLT